MHRFAARELAFAASGPATCNGSVCQSGDTCTNVTNSTQTKKKKPKAVMSKEHLDMLLAQLTELEPVG